MGNPKDKEQNSNAGAMGEGAESVHDACQASWDLSCERATTLDKMVVEAIARETARFTVMFTAVLNERTTINLPTSLKVTSGAAGIRLCPPLTGQRTKLSSRDGNYGLKGLDMPLIAWKETERRLKFHISTIG